MCHSVRVSRYFVSAAGQRGRRPADVYALVIGLVLVLWTAFTADRVLAIENAVVDVLGAFPSWFDGLYRVAYVTGALLVVVLLVGALAQRRKRLDLLRDMGLSIVAVLAVVVLLAITVLDQFPEAFPEFRSGSIEPSYPVLRVAFLAAVIAVASPHVTRPVRRFGLLMVTLVAIAGMGLGYGFPSDVVGALGIGLIAAAIVLIGFGSPLGYPDVDQIRMALAELGLDVAQLDVPERQNWGVRRLIGRLTSDKAIEVKAYGRDAVDAQLWSRASRKALYREQGRVFAHSRREAVEREALVTLIAAREGVHVEEILAVGVAGDDVALLATSLRGDAVTPDMLDEPTAREIWAQLAALHGSGIAHGSFTIDAIRLTDSGPIVTALGDASLNADDVRRHLDVVSLLAETTAMSDAETAVSNAAAIVGDEALAAALPFVQPPALTRSQRTRLGKTKPLIAAIRDAIVNQTGADPPEQAQLRRISPKDLLLPALSLIGAYALIGMLSDLDFAAAWDIIETASWGWMALGFLVGQLVFVFEATGMLYAVGYPLPLRPLVVLQVAVKWIGLAVPSAAGRVTMNAVFLRRYGASPTEAVTQGAIDGVAGFLVEVAILVIALLSIDASLDLDADSIPWEWILLVVGLLVAGTFIAIWRIEKLRDRVLPRLREAWGMLSGVAGDPRRAFGLLGSHLAARLILAIVLWFVLHAIGTPLPVLHALVATVATNLLAGLAPIPGGIGVAEAVLTSFLGLAGVPAEEAFAAAVVFRLATFYIPAIEGFFAMRWLEARGYV